MKRWISFLLIAVFSFLNVFAFIGCRPMEAEDIDEVRAAWVCSIGNMDFPSRMGLSVSALKTEIDTIIETCRRYELNTLFFQVRPNGDALYKSSIFPWSVYLTGTQGKAPADGFDPLAYFIKKAHRAKIQLHAWINPYRIGSGTRVWEGLSRDNPAVLHKDYTITSDTGVYYDPGHPDARQLILDGVLEIVRNYEIDGIHFDDYFYPYDLSGFDDSATYTAYGKGLSLEDFRRQSVNTLVESCYKEIKSIKKDVQFGISPFGIWANKWVDPAGSDTRGMSSYAAIFSDSKKWVEEGWLDYVCPQIYWTDQHEAAPFDVLVDWWDDLCTRHGMPLYIGMALYKVGEGEPGFEEGIVMGEQLLYASQKRSYAGHSFFRFGLLSQNPEGALDSILAYYQGRPQETEKPLNYPQLQKSEDLNITTPSNGSKFEAGHVSVAGTARAGSSVSVNGVEAVVTENGLFAAYVPLKMGKNTITVQSEGEQRSIRVDRIAKSEIKKLQEPYPTGSVHRGAGDVLSFSAQAPNGATVTLTNGQISIPLQAEKDGSSTYQGVWTIPSIPMGDQLLLDDFRYEVVLEGNTTVTPADLQLNIYSNGYRQEKILKEDAYIFDESSGGSQMDHDPLRQGTRVWVTGLEGTRALLENGYWVEQELLGDEPVMRAEPCGYDYEVLHISAKEFFGYSSYCDGEVLEITLSGDRTEAYDIDTDQLDLLTEWSRSASSSVLEISSGMGRKIAGYELIQQRGQLMVYLRFHQGGLAGKRIVLDAGHGGQDHGAMGPGGSAYPSESDLNLLLAYTLKKELENAGAEVTMTRTSDRTVTLANRTELAHSLAPDLFISLHHNSTGETGDYTSATGGLMLYSAPHSKSLAEGMAVNLWDGVGEKATRSKRQSLFVCRDTRYPAVLVEAGYLCNPLEYEMLCREDITKKIAKNMVKSLRDYFVTVCS